MTKTELEQCIEEYGKDIYSFCRHLAGCVQEADDLYQDTFLKAWELNKKIEYEKNPKSYLLSIALKLWKNRKRKYAWRMRIAQVLSLTETSDIDLEDPDSFPESSIEEQILQKEENELVQKAVEQLPERFKAPVLLYYMEELSVEEIAGLLKIPAGTVKSRLFQARKRLKKELEDVLNESIG